MDQAAYLKVIRLAKKATGMVRLVYEGEDGKPVSTLLYLSKYPDSDSANNAVKILKSKDKKPEDFLDKVFVGKGYLLVSLGKVLFSETNNDYFCVSGWYFDKDGISKTGYIRRDRFGTLPDGNSELNRAIPFERIISVGF
jgi:hypothetical protein